MSTRILVLALALLASSYGCFSRKAVAVKYYLLEAPAESDSTTANGVPLMQATCEILPVKVHPAFGDTRIPVRMNTHQLNYYVHHKWAVKPAESFTQFLEKYLQGQRLFSRASSTIWQLVPDYQLQTRVNRLEVTQNHETLSAHLDVEFALFELASKRVKVFHAFDKTVPLEEKDLNSFARVISELFGESLQEFSQRLRSYFQTEGLPSGN